MTRKSFFVGGLLTLILTAAVVGGSFAIFSDNVASDDQEFTAGTVDITVDNQDEFFTTDLDMPNMEAGDCSHQTVRVSNVGTLPINLWNWIYTWGDVFSCDPNPDCNMYVSKKLVKESADPSDGEEYIIPGGWEDYELEACLPLCAGNLCQSESGTMRMFFHAVQASNLDGWDCVKLLHKEAPYWIPDPNWTPNASGIPAHGNKCYEASVGAGPYVDFVVNGYNMTANMPLQLMLNGPGGCTAADMIIAGDFDLDGTVDSGYYDAYYRGFWTGTAMSMTCDGTGEGVYAIAQGGGLGGATPDLAAITDAAGNFSGQWTATLDACASQTGSYILQTKFLVKQDAAPWLEELDELDYQYIEFVCP
jgi:predicted ribosomally synthesized peptide with SipW-like signal peptide